MRYITIIIMITASIYALPLNLAVAASWSYKDNGRNKLNLSGKCNTSDITVALYRKEPKELVYSAGVKCINGSFTFADDLSTWNLPQGKYKIIVGDDGKTFEEINVYQKPQQLYTSTEQGEEAEQVVDDPNTSFYKKLSDVSEGIKNLHTYTQDVKDLLEKTTFADTTRMLILSSLDFIDLYIKNLTKTLTAISMIVENKTEQTAADNVIESSESYSNNPVRSVEITSVEPIGDTIVQETTQSTEATSTNEKN